MNKPEKPLARILATGALAAGALGSGAPSAQDHPSFNWGYDGDIGPAHWGSLDPSFATCSRGFEQSPIDLGDAPTASPPGVEFDYGPRSAEVVNNSHTIQVNVDPGSGIVVDQVRYDLLQFHFHRASEHTVAGTRFPLETHLVHQGEDGALAVVGVLHREGAPAEALAPIWNLLPAEPGNAVPVPGGVDLAALLPKRRTAWRYPGSLTTPPCTEGVSWVVMTEPTTLSAEQIAAFSAIHDGNYRPVQPRNGPVVSDNRDGP